MGGPKSRAALRAVLANNIRQCRHRLGLSQEQLGDLAGLHRTYVGAVERGERNLTVDNIEKIARALQVTPDVLLAETVGSVDGAQPPPKRPTLR
jgi:transcriptional regulator with XRE-family HTH domain